MSKERQTPFQIITLIRNFKTALKRYFSKDIYDKRKQYKNTESSEGGYYEEAKVAETTQRNLIKALGLYIKAIEHGEKKDSSIKDFASSLHQLGHTREAVNLMDDCEPYYDGNKEKYFRLRDNLELQIRPTGKHLCKFLLIENLSHVLKQIESEQEIKSTLFKSPKRIKKLKFMQDLDLLTEGCPKQEATNLLIEFESFSAAKKTLESFFFDQWFGVNLYWVNSSDMTIVCSATDGKKDLEGFVVTEDLIQYEIYFGKESFWKSFGENIYASKQSNGYRNLLAIHLIRENCMMSNEEEKGNKENIFESSKISHLDQSEQEWTLEKKALQAYNNNCYQSNQGMRQMPIYYNGPNKGYKKYSNYY